MLGWKGLRHLSAVILACQQAVMFWLHLLAPFPGTTVCYTIGSCLWKEWLENLCYAILISNLNNIYISVVQDMGRGRQRGKRNHPLLHGKAKVVTGVLHISNVLFTCSFSSYFFCHQSVWLFPLLCYVNRLALYWVYWVYSFLVRLCCRIQVKTVRVVAIWPLRLYLLTLNIWKSCIWTAV